MASHLAAQDYLARFQASGMNFPSLSNAADLQYPSLGLHSLTAAHHKLSRSSSKGGGGSSSSSLSKKDKNSIQNSLFSSSDKDRSKSPSVSNSSKSYLSNNKYETTLSVLSNMRPPSDCSSPGLGDNKTMKTTSTTATSSTSDLVYSKDTKIKSCSSSTSSVKSGSQSVSSIFTSPLSLASNNNTSASASTTQSTVNCSVAALPAPSILR